MLDRLVPRVSRRCQAIVATWEPVSESENGPTVAEVAAALLQKLGQYEFEHLAIVATGDAGWVALEACLLSIQKLLGIAFVEWDMHTAGEALLVHLERLSTASDADDAVRPGWDGPTHYLAGDSQDTVVLECMDSELDGSRRSAHLWAANLGRQARQVHGTPERFLRSLDDPPPTLLLRGGTSGDSLLEQPQPVVEANGSESDGPRPRVKTIDTLSRLPTVEAPCSVASAVGTAIQTWLAIPPPNAGSW